MNQWSKGIRSWQVGDTLYISVPFTWLMADAEKLAESHKGRALIGGPGTMTATECPGFDPVVFHNPCATFTTRGCPNSCSFCAVPKLEPEFREIHDFRPAPIICDNNLLAATRGHIECVVASLKQYRECDFNQGLESRYFTPAIADLLGTINCKVRFAFDNANNETRVHDAIKLCQQRTTKNIGVYVLIGFNDSPDEAINRLELVRSWGVRPNPMRYQPLDATVKNGYVGAKWTEAMLRKVTKYYSRLRYTEHIPFEEYDYLVHGEEHPALNI